MKLDSESYQRTCPSHEHETKVIVHNGNTFILAKDNHFMIDMLNVDKEAIKEGNHGLTSTTEREITKGTLIMENSCNRNQIDDECMEALYSSSTSGFEMVVKEDFYTDKIVMKVELPKNRICIEDDPSNIIKDISIDEGVCSSDITLVDKEEVSPIESSASNQALYNGHNEPISAMSGSACVDELKDHIFDSPVTIIDKDQAHSDSVPHNDFDGKISSVDSFDNEDKLGATAAVLSNLFTKVTENSANQVSYFHNDCDGKDSSVISVNDVSNLATGKSVSSNITVDITESLVVAESTVCNGCSAKGSSLSSENYGGMRDTTDSVSNIISPEVVESPAVLEYDVHKDCDEKGSSVSSYNCGKLDTAELVVPHQIAKVTEDQLPSSEEVTTGSLQVVSSSQICSNDQKHSVGGQMIQAISEESNLELTPQSFPSEVSVSSNVSEESPVNCKVPSGVISFSFVKEAASTSGRYENKETTNNQQPVVAQIDPITDEAIVDGPITSARSSILHLIQGESNLSGSALLSGPLANSGHIPYSGSISLRSDSSTTSARSFAFPILQSEWNSSPVRMAKADRRNLRKHRGWKMGLLCCRF